MISINNLTVAFGGYTLLDDISMASGVTIYDEDITFDLNGKTITVVLDDNALKERQGGQELGVAESSLMLYAAVEDLPPRRPAGEGLNIDGREYIVNDWSEDMGVATIALGQTVTM